MIESARSAKNYKPSGVESRKTAESMKRRGSEK